MPYGQILTDSITDSSGGVLAPSSSVFRNRIINGAMQIDQRNAGASVTPTSNSYTLDRWAQYQTQASKVSVQQNAASVTPPAGFAKYLGITSLSAYSVGTGDIFTISQTIEGLNVADLAWGTASAATVTLSFWVRSSLTGTFGGAFQNSSQNRSYPFTYTINSSNTWEQKSVTIAGDTSGTWLTTNGVGIYVNFGLGGGSTYSGTAGSWAGSNYFTATGATSVVGTSGATFYITGVQLEKGSTATSFDYRPYGTELALCQRYYYKNTAGSAFMSFGSGVFSSTTSLSTNINLPVTMRATPTLTYSGTIAAYDASFYNISSVGTSYVGTNTYLWQPVISGATTGRGGLIAANNDATAFLAFSSEL